MRTRAISWRHIAILACLGAVLAACGGGGSADTTTTTAADPATTVTAARGSTTSTVAEPACDEVTALKMSVPTQPPKFAQLAPFFAEALGFYDQFCIDMTIIGFRTGANALRALQSREVEIGIPSTNASVVAVAQGSPIVTFGSPASVLPQIILATGDIDTCEELGGKTLGTEGPGGLGHYLFTIYLESCGLDINNDVDIFVGAPGDFAALMDQGVIHAAALHVDDKGHIEEQFGTTLNVLTTSAELVPNFHYQSFAARADWVAGDVNRDALVRMLAAVLAAQRYVADPANRSDVIQIASDLSQRSPEVVDFAYDLYKYPTSCAEQLDPASFEYTAQTQVDAGEMGEVPPVNTLIDTSICEDAEALLGG